VTERSDDLLESESTPSEADVEEEPGDEDDEQRWHGEESLGLLPSD
jgi:hypothetical protein